MGVFLRLNYTRSLAGPHPAHPLARAMPGGWRQAAARLSGRHDWRGAAWWPCGLRL